MFVNKNFSAAYSLKSKQCYNANPLAYCFYVKTKILIDFDIYISVPLND